MKLLTLLLMQCILATTYTSRIDRMSLVSTGGSTLAEAAKVPDSLCTELNRLINDSPTELISPALNKFIRSLLPPEPSDVLYRLVPQRADSEDSTLAVVTVVSVPAITVVLRHYANWLDEGFDMMPREIILEGFGQYLKKIPIHDIPANWLAVSDADIKYTAADLNTLPDSILQKLQEDIGHMIPDSVKVRNKKCIAIYCGWNEGTYNPDTMSHSMPKPLITLTKSEDNTISFKSDENRPFSITERTSDDNFLFRLMPELANLGLKLSDEARMYELDVLLDLVVRKIPIEWK